MKNIAVMQHRFKNPGQFERDFVEFLKKAKLPFDNSKTIAQVCYFDQKTTAGSTSTEFFTGTFVPLDTNMPGGSFTKPQNEHQVITHIRIADGTSAIVSQTDWTPGVNFGTNKNAKMTVTNNNIVVLKDYPLMEALDGLTTSEQGLIELDEYFVWGGQTNLTVRVEFPVAPAVNENMRIELLGIGLI